MIDARVRLVFVGKAGRLVQQRLGFSSCWYLISRDAKLVGDLSHALLQDFELRKRCSMGLELRLEELPLLASQSIRIVRDNDTITVQSSCAEDKSKSIVVISEGEGEAMRKRKRVLLRKEQEQPLTKKRMTKDLKKMAKHQLRGIGASRRMTALKSIRVESSSSSSDCESSSKTSNSSETDNSTSTRHSSKRAVLRQPREQLEDFGSVKVSGGVKCKANAPASTEKKPRRRRRRLRQRNRVRKSDDKQVDNTAISVQLSGTDSTLPKQGTVASIELGNKVSSSAVQNGGSTAEPQDYPRAKSHVLFDEDSGDPVTIGRDAGVTEARTNKWVARRPLAPELAKYGPASSRDQRYESLSHNHQTASYSDQPIEQDTDACDSYDGSKQKRFGIHEERWKRSYEIVASVLNGKSQNSKDDELAASNLSKALNSFPAASANSSRFALKDVIAYKTLTLCLETCQPVLSEWKCGQVQSTDATGSIIEVSSWDLEFNNESVTFHESTSGDLHSVQVSDITELRYLSSPSCTALISAGQENPATSLTKN